MNNTYIKQDLTENVDRVHCSFLDKTLSKESEILIIGCGYGIESKQYPNAINLDIDRDCLLFCNKLGVSNLICASADHLPFKSRVFKNILMVDVIEHFPTLPYFRSVIIELKRVSDGNIIVVLPAKDRLTWIKSMYNKIMHIPLPIMAHPGHTLHLTKQKLIKQFVGFNNSLDCSQPGKVFGRGVPDWFGGGYIYIVMCMDGYIY